MEHSTSQWTYLHISSRRSLRPQPGPRAGFRARFGRYRRAPPTTHPLRRPPCSLTPHTPLWAGGGGGWEGRNVLSSLPSPKAKPARLPTSGGDPPGGFPRRGRTAAGQAGAAIASRRGWVLKGGARGRAARPLTAGRHRAAPLSLTPSRPQPSPGPGGRTYSGDAPPSRAARWRRRAGGGSRSHRLPWRRGRRPPPPRCPGNARGDEGRGAAGVGGRPLVPGEPRCAARLVGAAEGRLMISPGAGAGLAARRARSQRCLLAPSGPGQRRDGQC